MAKRPPQEDSIVMSMGKRPLAVLLSNVRKINFSNDALKSIISLSVYKIKHEALFIIIGIIIVRKEVSSVCLLANILSLSVLSSWFHMDG